MPTYRSRYLRNCYTCAEEIDTLHSNMYHYCESCIEYTCTDCYCGPCCPEDIYDDDDDYSRDSRVYHYDYRPRFWNSKGEFPMRPLMGVELEVCNSWSINVIPDVVQELDPNESHLFVKEDGSLCSGLEIVSHPATLEWTRTYPWSNLLERLQDERCSSPDGYGLHVHVSRNAFRRQGRRSPTHQLTWLLFLHRNPRQLELLARRRDDQWASFRKPMRGELVAKAHAHEGYSSSRYVAVNCNNQKTYELRFFKSTLDYGEFMAAVEFADASVEYTRAIKTADILTGQALSWPHFAGWVDSRDYVNLSDQIRTQGTLGVTTLLDDVVNRRPDDFTPDADDNQCDCRGCRRDRESERRERERFARESFLAAYDTGIGPF